MSEPVDLSKYVLDISRDDYAAGAWDRAKAVPPFNATFTAPFSAGIAPDWSAALEAAPFTVETRRPWWAFWRKHVSWSGRLVLTGSRYADSGDTFSFEFEARGPLVRTEARTLKKLRAAR